MLTGSADMSARLWDIKSQMPVGEYRDDAMVVTVAFHGADRIVTGSVHATARLWDVKMVWKLEKDGGHRGCHGNERGTPWSST